jgi:hypothetical protein
MYFSTITNKEFCRGFSVGDDMLRDERRGMISHEHSWDGYVRYTKVIIC